MPSAPGHTDYEIPSDNSDDDPDYREDSDEGDEDDLPPSMGRDRAQWMIDNREALAEVYRALKSVGQDTFGTAFLQLSSLNAFGNFVYKYTTPGAT
jgi:hypothetical protein